LHGKILLESAYFDRANAARRASVAVPSFQYSLPAQVRRPIIDERGACQADPFEFGLLGWPLVAPAQDQVLQVRA
jgi:hypothetical protein